MSKLFVYRQLEALRLEPRTVGGSDRGLYNPLHEVRTLAKHCAGGIILGYSQVTANTAKTLKYDEAADGSVELIQSTIRHYRAPTPWNQLETGVLFGLGLPLFVLRQRGITGGIFDEGAGDVLVHTMPMPGKDWSPNEPSLLANEEAEQGFNDALLRWQALVRSKYYDDADCTRK